ncbi:MAG: M23 family metallopeptidase [Deltaproteobacteria bacterium]|nr:M23 family metallopeptidase [Deltaproteobacteria bacterium]
MDNKFLTFFILSNDAANARQFKLKVKSLKIAGGIGAFFFLVLAFVVVDYSRIKYNTSELYSLRKETTAQKVEIQNFAGKIRDLETRLASLNIFDKKIRIIANLDGPKNAPAQDQAMGLGGVGGGLSPDDQGFATPKAKVNDLIERMKSDIKQLESRANRQESSFTELQGQLVNKASFLASTPSIWPVRGWVTSTFGDRINPFTGFNQLHNGMDIANRMGTPIAATANGIVVQADRDPGLGKVIGISHGYGIKTVYGHLSEIHVRVGQKVKRGDKIGAMGSTGNSTGPHLHYQLSVNGVTVNPAKYLLN